MFVGAAKVPHFLSARKDYAMKLGVVFPQTEIGSDPVALRDFAQAVEGLGYDYILTYDHVLGASTENRHGWTRYSSEDMFHEPFVLFGYLAGFTRTIEFVTGVLILPQRQTVLVAKQAAQVDVLSGGRMRLGIGAGWNEVEYVGLNENFKNRGARMDEQVAVMRALWTNPVVTFKGQWHAIEEAGINPLPVQRPIPIWFGGETDKALRRTARLGDGWIALGAPNEERRGLIERLHTYLHEAGRTPQDFGIESHIVMDRGNEETWAAETAGWATLGATHLCIGTMNMGFRSVQEHIEALRRMKTILTTTQI
jgi:probable F420-dependent oxidoreductase